MDKVKEALLLKNDYPEAFGNEVNTLNKLGTLQEAKEAFKEKALSMGVELHVAGEFDLASQMYDAVIKFDPDHADANHNMGLLKLATGHDSEALQYLHTALQSDTSVAQFWLSYIKALIQLNRVDEASRVLSLANERGAEGEQFFELHQQLAETTVKVEPVKSEADTSSQSNPNILDNLKLDKALRLAKNNVKEGSSEEAKRIYQDILKKFPKNKRAQQGLVALNKSKKSAATQSPPQDTINQLINLYNQGQLTAVVEQAQALTEQYPKAFGIWNIIGVAKKGLGHIVEASEAFKKVIEINPSYVDGFSNLGVTLHEQGKLDEALEAYNKALLIKPDSAELHFYIGNSLKNHGKLEEAIKAYKSAIELKDNYTEAHNNLGIALKDQGNLDDAIEAYNKALSVDQKYVYAHYNLGKVFHTQGKLDEALEAYNKALLINPDYTEAYNNMGTAFKHQGKLEKAIEAYNKALSLKPDYAEAYNNIGVAFQDQGELDEAIEAFNKALSLKPDYAEAHRNLSFVLLNNGNITDGLAKNEWRWKITRNSAMQRKFSIPVWDGRKSLRDKRILLWSEQGVGDTINWSSRLPLISSQAQHCSLECPEKLVPLLTRSFPNVEIKSEDKSRDALRDDLDFHLPLGSLYRHFIPQILNDPKPNAFLIPDPTRINFWKQRLKSLGSGPYIGVSWKSSNMSPKRLPNYAPISDWCPIFKIDGITYINLQYVDYESDLAKIKSEFGVTVHNFDDLDHYNNIDDVAALCAALDMVVSTKITVPLISAGVGTITKLANWRQSSWNNILLNPVGPELDIFERNTWEPWNNVFNEIAADIIKLKNRQTSTSGSL